jgi:hypothetical protein
MTETRIVPPPWKLTGRAYIVFYRFSHNYVNEHGFVPSSLDGMYVRSVGSLMLVDYSQSPVGPFQEALFIPGRFAYGRKDMYSITKAYSSTQTSVDNERANWGLPTELADFTVTHENGLDRFQVALAGRTFLDLSFKPGSLPFPASTRMFNLPIQQPTEAGIVVTRPRAFGWARLADLTRPRVDSAYFPDVSEARPVGTIYLPRFKLTLPAPKVTT